MTILLALIFVMIGLICHLNNKIDDVLERLDG